MACTGIHNFSCAEHFQGSVEHRTVITFLHAYVRDLMHNLWEMLPGFQG